MRRSVRFDLFGRFGDLNRGSHDAFGMRLPVRDGAPAGYRGVGAAVFSVLFAAGNGDT